MNATLQRMTLTLVTGFLIGGVYIVGKQLLLQGFSPVAVSFVQVAGAAVLLQTGLHARGLRPPTDARTLRFFAIAATIAVIGSTLLGNWVLSRIPAGIFTLLVTLSPLFTSLINAAVDRRLPPLSALGGTALGLAGVSLVLVPRAQGVDPEQVLALGIALAVPVLLAVGNVYRARNWPHRVAAPMVSASTLSVQGLVLLPLFASLHDGADMARLGSVWPVLGLMVLVTVAANISAAYLQRASDSVAFSQIGYVIALTGVGLGALLFGERVGWLFVPALLLVFGGIVLVNRAPGSRRRQAQEKQGLQSFGRRVRNLAG